ncbi:facilitated trehalose transporter Tret1-like isoform X2 [Artemia franciscana]|uniref:facilitated trehalose transporter Tret1-like isoform X2 n=1 Tax=Artemia franciscana TaxID=6661 RepID=UPI0032DB0C95
MPEEFVLEKETFEGKNALKLQIAIALAASMAFMISGGVRSWSSPCIPRLLELGSIKNSDVPYVGGLPPVGALLGALVSAPLMQFLGSVLECDVLSWILASGALLLGVGMYFAPESPSWLILHGRENEARASLKLLKNLQDPSNPCITEHINKVKEILTDRDTNSNQTNYTEYLKESVKFQNLRPFFLSLTIMFFEEFCGISTIIFHSGTIFKNSGSNIDRHLSSIVVGLVQLVFTCIAMLIVDKTGRRKLLLLSSSIMLISLVPISVYFQLKNVGYESIGNIHWIPLVSLIFFMVGFSLGYNTLPYLIMSEILPSKFRNLFSAIIASFNLFCLFLTVFFYPIMVDLVGEHGVFWLYTMCCFISIIFVYFFLPETKGKSLEEIEMMFRPMKKVEVQENKAFECDAVM